MLSGGGICNEKYIDMKRCWAQRCRQPSYAAGSGETVGPPSVPAVRTTRQRAWLIYATRRVFNGPQLLLLEAHFLGSPAAAQIRRRARCGLEMRNSREGLAKTSRSLYYLRRVIPRLHSSCAGAGGPIEANRTSNIERIWGDNTRLSYITISTTATPAFIARSTARDGRDSSQWHCPGQGTPPLGRHTRGQT